MTPTHDPSTPGSEVGQHAGDLSPGEVLAPARPRELRGQPDELLFHIVHHGTEQLLTSAAEDVDDAAALLRGGRPADAAVLLRRTATAVSLCIEYTGLLRHLTPAAFPVVRAALRQQPWSQSSGWQGLHTRCATLSQVFDGYLAAHDVTLVSLYTGSPARPLYQLAETLVDIDERVSLWSAGHYLLAARVLGDAAGTQGASVASLATLIDRHLFPQLWAVRTQLSEPAAQP